MLTTTGVLSTPPACADQSSDFLLRHACTGFAVTNLSYRGGTLIHSETSIKEIIAVRCNYLSQNSVLMEQHAPDSEVDHCNCVLAVFVGPRQSVRGVLTTGQQSL